MSDDDKATIIGAIIGSLFVLGVIAATYLLRT